MLHTDQNNVIALLEARRQARGLRAFYIHLAAYLGVMALLVFINLSTGDALDGNWWVQWPAMGWGVGVALHALMTSSGGNFLGAEWEERKVAELMKRKQSH